MSHPEQIAFCKSLRRKFPARFKSVSVLDVGSLDINGNNRYLFENCSYIGIDFGPGNNVDLVCPAHEFKHGPCFDVIISTEALEHDRNYAKTLNHVAKHLLCPGGLFIFTCATTGRLPHGIYSASPQDSPETNDYYLNLTEEDIRRVLIIESIFSIFEFETNIKSKDLYFWGIKK